jgi:Flp pilus assembly pilin Flp
VKVRTVLRRVAAFFREDPGQDLIEYSLLIAFLAMAAVAVMSQLGVGIRGPWDSANTTLASAGGATISTATTQPPADHGDHGDHDGSGR